MRKDINLAKNVIRKIIFLTSCILVIRQLPNRFYIYLEVIFLLKKQKQTSYGRIKKFTIGGFYTKKYCIFTKK